MVGPLRPGATALIATFAVAGGRPCADGDWRFAFGVCSPDEHRNVYAYPSGLGGAESSSAVCDTRHPDSRPQPTPLFNLSCRFSCPSGTHLGVNLAAAEASTTVAPSGIAPHCETCPAGKFSLGGGLMVSGVAGDWARPWPSELQSSCMYRDSDDHWYTGGLPAGGCQLRIEAPNSVRGSYEAGAADWNEAVPSPFTGPLAVAPGDGLGCEALGQLDSAGSVLLVRQGGCAAREKAANAARAGARAVLVVGSRYRAGPVSPSGAGGPPPGIPLMAISREDGEILVLAAERSQVFVNATRPDCASETAILAAAELAATPGGPPDGGGCAPWQADPLGEFVHSGDNRPFHNIVSILTLSTRFVRDGYVIFRYAVDSERGFDGLSFEVDWNEVMSSTSVQPDFTDFKVNLTAGLHTMRWWYSKDYSVTGGEDLAKIQIIELVGTSHADLACRSCHSDHTYSGAGAAHCNACGHGEYLALGVDADRNFAECNVCPAGRWSPLGSVGNAACRETGPCGAENIEETYTQCRSDSRYQRRSWKEPLTCNPNMPGSIELNVNEVSVPCEPCQPDRWRQYGNDCVPRVVSCPAGQHAQRELIINSWVSWPENVTQEVWTMQQDLSNEDPTERDDDHPDGHGWMRAVDGQFAFAGDSSLAIMGAARVIGRTHDDEGSHRFGNALLHLDVVTDSPGEVRFCADVLPTQRSWRQDADFLVDGGTARGMRSEWDGPHLHVSAPLAAGAHRLTWAWRYGPRTGNNAYGMRVLNVTVSYAVGAGASVCRPCPPGLEVSGDGLRCTACFPGSFLTPGSDRCETCLAGTFANQPGASVCELCGEGTSSPAGASSCALMPEVSTPDPQSGGRLRFDVMALATAWLTATESAGPGAPGPFSVAGRRYFLSLFSHSETPGLGGGGASYAFELMPREGADRDRDRCVGSVATREVESLGRSVVSVQGIASGVSRGVRLTYGGGEPCEGSANASRGAVVTFVCDASASAPTPARRDHVGMHHLARLRLARSTETQQPGCPPLVSLEWPVRAACPLCRETDFAPQRGACGGGSRRQVTFVMASPCNAGVPAPASYEEPCGDDMEDDRETMLLKLMIVLATSLGLCLCCYAGYLHKTYAKYATSGGQPRATANRPIGRQSGSL